MKLSSDQRLVTAEFLANIGVAWFATGFIVPIFSGIREVSQLLISGTIGTVGAAFFLLVSLSRLKGAKNG